MGQQSSTPGSSVPETEPAPEDRGPDDGTDSDSDDDKQRRQRHARELLRPFEERLMLRESRLVAPRPEPVPEQGESKPPSRFDYLVKETGDPRAGQRRGVLHVDQHSEPIPRHPLDFRVEDVNPRLLNVLDQSGFNYLHRAVQRNDADAALRLLAMGAFVNAKEGHHGQTALMLAAVEGQAAMAELLLAHGADPDTRDSQGLTAFALAAVNRHEEVMKLLAVKFAARVDCVDACGRTPLHYLASDGCDRETVLHMVRSGVPLDAPDSEGNTPLLLAVMKQRAGTALALIAAGADVNRRNKAGNPSLHLALLTGQVPLAMSLLAEAGTKLDVSLPNNDGRTALHTACIERLLAVAEALVRRGVDANRRDRDGRTALHHVVAECKRLAESSAGAGASQSVAQAPPTSSSRVQSWISSKPQPPLPVLAQWLELLVKTGGADIHVLDRAGESPYQLALKIGDDYCTANYLVRLGRL